MVRSVFNGSDEARPSKVRSRASSSASMWWCSVRAAASDERRASSEWASSEKASSEQSRASNAKRAASEDRSRKSADEIKDESARPLEPALLTRPQTSIEPRRRTRRGRGRGKRKRERMTHVRNVRYLFQSNRGGSALCPDLTDRPTDGKNLERENDG